MSTKRRETSKMLLWSVVVGTGVFCAASMIIAVWTRDVTVIGIVITAVIGLGSIALPVVANAYSEKAKAENIIKHSQSEEIEYLRAELEALRAELEALRADLTPKPKAPRKTTKASPSNDLVGQIRVLLEQSGGETV